MDYPKSVPSVGLVGGKFVDENQATGVVGSLIPSHWGNAVTDEILAVIKAAGLSPDEANNGQLLAALQDMLRKSAGRLLRTSVYTVIAGVQMVSVNGGAPTAVGATTFTPLATATAVRAKVQGAGGGSSGTWTCNSSQVSAGGGGGGGSFAEGWFTPLAAGLAVTVGVGGAGAAANASSSGGTGGASSFGSLLSCPGGGGSVNTPSPSTAAGISGGTSETAAPSGSNIIYSVRGAPGVYGYQMAGVAGVGWGGTGGHSQFGSGRAVIGTSVYPGSPGLNWGAGAAGAFTPPSGAGQPGAKGADGIVIIEEYA